MSEIDFAEVDAAPAEPAAPDTDTPAEPAAAPAPTFAALDHVIPEADDVDEDYRGKPIKEVLRVAKQHKEEAKRAYNAGSDANNWKSRAEMAENLLRLVQQQRPQAPPPNPQAILQEIQRNPAEAIQQLTRQTMQPFEQELNNLKLDNYHSKAELARERARQSAGVEGDAWEALARPLAAIISANNGDPASSKTWGDAFEVFRGLAPKVAPKVTVPTQQTPPVGQARSTGARERTAPRLSTRDEKNLKELAGIFSIKQGSKAWDQLVKDIQSDPTAMGAMFNE